ncbi:MAG: PorV/PorQ family protein [bacterium]
MASVASWIEKTKLGIIGYCSPISDSSGFGLSVLYLKTDKMPLYKDVNTSQSGEFDASDLSIRLGFGAKVTRSNYLGIVGGWINQRIEEEKSRSFFFDIGEIYKPKSLDKMAFSIVLQNLGGKVKFIEEEDELPSTLNLGFAYFPAENIIFSLDLVKPKDNNYGIRSGFEWDVKRILTLRAGFNSQVFQDLGIGISGGFGIKIDTFNLDYSYVPYRELGETHNLSLTTHFGR